MSSSLSEIGIRVQPPMTGNVQPLLHEIRHALEQLIELGRTHVIDLRALPLAPGESEQIEEVLGHGEVEARLEALGPSEIRETAYPGVWLVTHHNSAGELVGKFVEIAPLPKILEAQQADMRHGLARLRASLPGESDG